MSNFITTVEGDIVAVGEAAWAQVKAELMTLEQDVLSIIKADIQMVVGRLQGGGTAESIETILLNLWSADKPQILSALSSGAIQVLIAVAKAAVAAI